VHPFLKEKEPARDGGWGDGLVTFKIEQRIWAGKRLGGFSHEPKAN